MIDVTRRDQTEAMTMATRIVIMKDGIVQQVGAPKTVYNQPCEYVCFRIYWITSDEFYSRHYSWR